MKCPSEECHNNLEGVRRTLYGNDGKGGLVACVSKKISTNLAIAFLTFALTFSGGFILYGLAAEKKQNSQLQEIGVIKEQVKQIKENTEKIGSKVDKMDDHMRAIELKQMTPEQYKAIMKEVIKENNGN